MSPAERESLEIRGISVLRQSDLAELVLASEAEGYRFIRRLADEWESGACRFDKEGEALFGTYRDDRLLGVAGLTIDPFAQDHSIGRLRRVYVLPEARGRGIARALVQRVLEQAPDAFGCVRL